MAEKSEFKSALDDLARGAHTGAEIHSVDERATPEGPEHPSIVAMRERFGDAVLRSEVRAGDEPVVFIPPEKSLEILRWLKEDPEQRYELLLDVTAVDYGGERPLQVVYELRSLTHKRRLRVKAELPLRALEIDSAVPVWAGANWQERECYDMFGITFNGHPDLRRILMPENYAEGHPLRKDFPLRGRFSRAEQTRRALAMEIEDFYIPTELDVMKRHGAAATGAGSEVFTPAAGDVPSTEEGGPRPRKRAAETQEPAGGDTAQAGPANSDTAQGER